MSNNDNLEKNALFFVESAFLAADDKFVAVMKMNLERFQPEDGKIPYGLQPTEKGIQVYFESESLFYPNKWESPDTDLRILRESFLVSEERLSKAERGLHQTPDDWTDHEVKDFSFKNPLPDDIEIAIIQHAKENPDPIMSLIYWSTDDNYDQYINSIANENIRFLAKKLWKEHAHKWV